MDLYDRNIWNRRVIISMFMLVYGMARMGRMYGRARPAMALK